MIHDIAFWILVLTGLVMLRDTLSAYRNFRVIFYEDLLVGLLCIGVAVLVRFYLE